MLSYLTFCRSEMGGGMDFWGVGGSKHNGKARPKSKCDNARKTYAYPTKLGGFGKGWSAYK